MHVAMAAAALMISDVGAARAATKFCDIYPERCQYSADGVGYYYPLGYRMPGEILARPASARKNTGKRKKSTTTARKEPVTIGREKTFGDEAQASRPGSNR
jgi:hypothetical protein